MSRDKSPVPYTCPKINEVISAIQTIEWPDNSWWTSESLINIMEDIRTANHALREWGNEKTGECDDLENEIFDLKSSVKTYTNEIEDLKDIIIELQIEMQKFIQKNSVNIL